MNWLFWDITETVTLGELLWTFIALLGLCVCSTRYVVLRRTWRYLIDHGIDGAGRMLARLRCVRAIALAFVFECFLFMGITSMLLPPNQAAVDEPIGVVGTVCILLVEVVLVIKTLVEVFYEAAIERIIRIKEAASAGTTPRLSD